MIQTKEFSPRLDNILPERYAQWPRAIAIQSFFESNVTQLGKLSEQGKLPLDIKTTCLVLDSTSILAANASATHEDGGVRAESFTRGISLALDPYIDLNHKNASDNASRLLREAPTPQDQEWGILGYIVGRIILNPDPGSENTGAHFVQLLPNSFTDHSEINLKDWNVETWPLQKVFSSIATSLIQEYPDISRNLMRQWDEKISHHFKSKQQLQAQPITAKSTTRTRPY